MMKVLRKMSSQVQYSSSKMVVHRRQRELGQLSSKDLGILSKQMLKVRRQNEQLQWVRLNQELYTRIINKDIDPRSASTILLSIAKSKQLQSFLSFRKFEAPVSLMLARDPDPRHLTQFLTAFSRYKGCSQQLLKFFEQTIMNYVQKFNPRQLTNNFYSLILNGAQAVQLKYYLEELFSHKPQIFSLQEICLIFKGQLARGLPLPLDPSKVQKQFLLRRRQCNVEDFTDLFCYFLQTGHVSQKLFDVLDQSLELLKKHLDEPQLLKILKHIHHGINNNMVPINMLTNIIKFIQKLLADNKLFKQRIQAFRIHWRKIENKEVRQKLLKLL